MAMNLLDLLSRTLSTGATSTLAKHLGEPESAVQSGVALLLPALLGGLASKVTSPGGASSVFSMLTGPKVDPGLLDSLGTMLNSGQASGLAGLGSSLLGGLFGADKAGGLGAALAGISGLKSSSATSLVTMVAPLVFGVLKKLISDQNLNPTRTAALLTGQKDHLIGQLDPAMTSALGLGSPAALLAGLAPAAAAVERTVVAGGSAAVAGAAGAARWWPWLIGALLLLAALWYFLSPPSKAPVAIPVAPTAAAIDLKTPAKVYFETGKADLGADGGTTIKAVAALLAASPSTNVAITGYTDKTGDGAANQALAKNRALAVQSALVAAGVAAARIEARPPVFVEIGAGGADAEARRVEIGTR